MNIIIRVRIVLFMAMYKRRNEISLTFGEFSDKLKSGEERIVKLEWKENGKVYKEDLVIKK